MQEIFTRVAKWNKARYAQEFNLPLTLKLLREEYREWMEAETRVDQVHELCDIVYVAMGALWKLGEELAPDLFEDCVRHVDTVASRFKFPGTLASTSIDCLELEGLDTQTQMGAIYNVALFAQAQILDYGLTANQMVECLHVLCDSNDSKTVKKTASDVKANDKDKGAYYKSPIPGLQAIIGAVH